jgi:hypothetical protein
MGAAARLAFAPHLRPELLPLGVGPVPACIVCGSDAEGVTGYGDGLTDGFTDYAALSARGPSYRAWCSPCLAMYKLGQHTAPKTANPTRRPEPGTCGYLFADQSIQTISAGPRGVATLVALATRSAPFAVLVGGWRQTRHYWTQALVCHPAPVFPILRVENSTAWIVWAGTAHLQAVLDALPPDWRTRPSLAGLLPDTVFARQRASQYDTVSSLINPRDPACLDTETADLARSVLQHP